MKKLLKHRQEPLLSICPGQGRELRYNGIEHERDHDGKYRAGALEAKLKESIDIGLWT